MTASPRHRRVASVVAVAALLAAYFLLATSAARTKSNTFDEIAHITAGYSFWTLNDYRLQPENGNWPQRLAGLPAATAGATFPSLDDPNWLRSDVYALGRTFFFESGNDVDTMIANARAMIALLGVALGALVFVWSYRLNGPEGAFVSLFLYVVSPTLMAHGALATSDMAAALGFIASAGTMWLLMERVTIARLLASCLAVATVFLSKFSAPVLIPVALCLAAIRLVTHEPLIVSIAGWQRTIASRLRQVAVVIGLLIVHAIAVWAIIWASYGFRYEAFERPPRTGEQLLVDWPMLLSEDDHVTRSVAGDLLDWTRTQRLLPEAYIYGFGHTVKFAQSRRAFMDGEYSLTGWRTFFPYAFAIKTTIPLMLLGILGVAALAIGRRAVNTSGSAARSVWSAAAPWLVLSVVYWIFAITTNLNIGHRHLLPVYPALIILAGGTGVWIRRAFSSEAAAVNVPAAVRVRRKARVSKPAVARPPAGRPRAAAALAGLLIVWHGVESFAVRPHYLAYFNQLAGGPSNGYRHLVDSSLDWGQDLPALKAWLDEHAPPGPQRPAVYLSYFGTSSPRHYGIEAVMLESYLDPRQFRTPAALVPGIYCVSATMLQGVYLAVNGGWDAKSEETYRMMSSLVKARLAAGSPEEQARLNAAARVSNPEFWAKGLRLYDELRTARLMAHLRRREPAASAGHSILIYRLTEADLAAALEGPPPYD